MSDIVCNKCGLLNDYRTEMKSNNNVAYCNGCNAYIKNIPYAKPIFYFGKYKGVEISNIDDLSYLEWAIKNVKMNEYLRKATDEQIIKLKNKNNEK